MPSNGADGGTTDSDTTDSDADLVTLSRDELRELVREEARDVAREEAHEEATRTRSLGGGVLAGLLGLVVFGQAATVDGGLTVALVGVGALLLVAGGVGVTGAFDSSET